MYLERTFIARTGVVGLEFYMKNIRKSTCRLQFVTLVTALEQDNLLIKLYCLSYLLSRPTLNFSISPRNSNNKDKRPIILPCQTSYLSYPLQLSSSTYSLTLNILYPLLPPSLTLFTKKNLLLVDLSSSRCLSWVAFDGNLSFVFGRRVVAVLKR